MSKFNVGGSALIYSTYICGLLYAEGGSITVDALGNAYVTGEAISSIFPVTPGAFQTTHRGNGDAAVTKLNTTGSGLLYSTLLGGSGSDAATCIAVDRFGNAYVTGLTQSSDFPTTAGAFQTSLHGFTNAFVSKLNATGSVLLQSTYLGGSNDDRATCIAVDLSGNAYVTGRTTSTDFPTTPGAFQTVFGGGNGDAFISKFSFGGIPFSHFSGKLELDLDAGSFEFNAAFQLGPGGSINPPTQPVSLTIGTFSVTIPAGSFVRNREGYAFEGVINGVSLEVLIKFGGTPGSYSLLAEGRGASLKGTTNPVTVTLSIGNELGTTQINAEFE